MAADQPPTTDTWSRCSRSPPRLWSVCPAAGGAVRVLAKAQRKLARLAIPATIGPIGIASVRRQLDRLSDDLDAGRTPT
jgi:hypothetical protein